jgi:hypothetical protein
MMFDYGSLTGRNIGFVDESERPRNVIAAAMMRPFVRRAIHQLTACP